MSIWQWFLHVTGATNEAGGWYGFWSGFGGATSNFAIIGAALAFLRHRNCVVHGCWRLGRHATSGGHVVCRRHHPAGAPTAQDVIDAHGGRP